MGNSWSEQVVSICLLIYRALKQKVSVYLYGQWTQGPAGLTFEEINEFESQFGDARGAPYKWRYGHRLDAPVHERFRLTIVGSDVDDVVPESLVVPRVKPEQVPPVTPFDQLNLNCSTVNAVALLLQWFMYQEESDSHASYTPSRLFLYYEARSQSDNDVTLQDNGVSFSDVFAVLNLCTPIPDELEWPYSVHAVNRKPPVPSVEDEQDIPFVGVQLNPTLNNLVTCVRTNGPFVAAVSATREFELHAKYTYDSTDLVLGYQPLVFYDFNEADQTFMALNSFGVSWGDRGRVKLHVADLFKDPVFTSSIYTLVPDLGEQDEEKSD